MNSELKEVTGTRGEKFAELALSNYEDFDKPLFRSCFLGDKWPTIDLYVELASDLGKRFYFFVQIKSTTSPFVGKQKSLQVTTKKKDIDRLLCIPGPTYILGVHEKLGRAFIRSVHMGIPVKAITRIPLSYELTSANLLMLRKEVTDFWATVNHKPTESNFV